MHSLLLAAVDQKSAAYKMGESIGAMVGVVIVLGLVALFILSVVKAATKKSTGWIVMAVLSGIVGLLVVLGSVAAVVANQGTLAKKMAAKTPKVISSKSGAISVQVPGDWVDAPNLLAGSELGAMKGSAELYTLVMATPKMDYTGDLPAFDSLLSKAMEKKMTGTATMSDPVAEPVGGYPALRRRLEGRIDNLHVVYFIAHLGTKDSFYEVLTWTMASKEAEAEPVLKQVMNSFTAKAGPPDEAAPVEKAAKPE